MSQTHFAGLIQDPEINAKMQLFARLSFGFQASVNELPPEKIVYSNSFFAKAINIVKPLLAVNANTTIGPNEFGIEEGKNLLDGLFDLYKKAYISTEKAEEIKNITPEMENSITPEEEEMLRSEFNEIISRTNFPQECIESNISASLQNDFLRGGTVTFLKPEQPINNKDLRQIQEGLFNRYKDHFDLQDPSQDRSNMLHVEIFFDPKNLETEYKNLINVRNKINEIYNDTNNNLSEIDKKYCKKALGDIFSFLCYLSNQMTTIVSLEPQATIKEFGDLQIKLSQYLGPNINVREGNLFSELLFSLDKTSVECAQKFLNEAKNPKEAAQKIYKALLASQKEVELNCRSLNPSTSKRGDTDQVQSLNPSTSKRGDTDQVPVNINSRFRDLIYMYSQIDILGIPVRNGGNVNSGAFDLSITRMSDPKMSQVYKLYNEILIAKKNIESKITKIGRAVLTKTKDKKRNLEEQLNSLNEYAKKLDDNISNLKVFFSENEEKNHDINEKTMFLFNNFEDDINKKIELLNIISNLKPDEKNNFINKAFDIFNEIIPNSKKEEAYVALCYIFGNNIPIQEFIKENGEINIEALCNFYNKNKKNLEQSQVSKVKNKIKNENKKTNVKQ